MYYRITTPEILRNAPSLDSDVIRWKAIVSAYHILCFVDRIDESMVMPFQMKLYERARLPDLNGPNMSYEECCDQRATELYQLSAASGLPLSILWSGGVDSTVVLVSLLKAIPQKLWHDRLHVYLSPDSLRENPFFYQKYIRPNLVFRSSSALFNSMLERRCLIVTGELNDQLHGSDVVGKAVRYHKDYLRAVLRPTNYKAFSTLLGHIGVHPVSCGAWYDFLSEHAKRCPLRLSSAYDLLWWFAFIFKWQEVYFRTFMKANSFFLSGFSDEFITGYCHHFFDTVPFQRWALANPHLKIKDTWESYKFHAKELIHRFDGNDEYLHGKRKIGSLITLESLRHPPYVAIGADFKFHPRVDYEAIYRKDHFFHQV